MQNGQSDPAWDVAIASAGVDTAAKDVEHDATDECQLLRYLLSLTHLQ